MAAPAPAPRELWENMIGQEITMDNIDMMLDERPDINDSIVWMDIQLNHLYLAFHQDGNVLLSSTRSTKTIKVPLFGRLRMLCMEIMLRLWLWL